MQRTHVKINCSFFLKVRKNSFAMPVRKGFPYKDLINYQLEKMIESGVMDHIKKRHLTPLSSTRSFVCSSKEVEKCQKHKLATFTVNMYCNIILGSMATIHYNISPCESLFLFNLYWFSCWNYCTTPRIQRKMVN